jgi:uncharacterized membrane protein YhaH (DUF805 family)
MNRYFEMLKQYVVSGGQVSRKESRIFTLLALIAGFLLGFVGIFVEYSGFIMAYFILGGCVLSMLIPSIAISVSVLNDANRSGWWLLISFIPLIGSIILLGFVEKESRIFTLSALIAGFLLGSVGIHVGDIGLVVLMGLGGFAVLIPSIVLSVSVLNDANRSGWWLLISFIPLIGSIILLGFVEKESRIFTLSALIAGFLLGSVGIHVGDIGLVVLMGLGGFAVLIPSIVLSVSVLNDANRSGWWLLISFIPFIGSMILLGFTAQDSQSNENQGGCNPEDAAA